MKHIYYRVAELCLLGFAAVSFSNAAVACDTNCGTSNPAATVECPAFPKFNSTDYLIACSTMPVGTRTFATQNTRWGTIVPFDKGNDGTVDQVYYLSNNAAQYDQFSLAGISFSVTPGSGTPTQGQGDTAAYNQYAIDHYGYTGYQGNADNYNMDYSRDYDRSYDRNHYMRNYNDSSYNGN